MPETGNQTTAAPVSSMSMTPPSAKAEATTRWETASRSTRPSTSARIPVSEAYHMPFDFPGTLEKVEVKLKL